jgi:uncharacterized membrane protein YgcG
VDGALVVGHVRPARATVVLVVPHRLGGVVPEASGDAAREEHGKPRAERVLGFLIVLAELWDVAGGSGGAAHQVSENGGSGGGGSGGGGGGGDSEGVQMNQVVPIDLRESRHKVPRIATRKQQPCVP